MTGKTRYMSRRAILSAASITPAALFMLAVSPQVEAQIAASAAANNLRFDDGWKFGEICKHLWAAFAYGAGEAKIGGDVLNAALLKSVSHVVQNLSKFPADAKDIPTVICAYLCGAKAAAKAQEKNDTDPVIDKAIFDEAWDEVQSDMAAIIGRARRSAGVDSSQSGLAC